MNKKVLRKVIKPSYKDHFLSPFPVDFDPDVVGYILDEGSRGNLELQDDLFNTMEDTWDRLRTNLNKLKKNVISMPREVMPATFRTEEISEDAAKKAAFIEELMHDAETGHPEDTLDLNDTIYGLLNAIGRGISVLEINWKISKGAYVPVSTNQVPASCLGFEIKSPSDVKKVNPEELMLYPDRNKADPRSFSKYKNKFLIGIYRGKSGHLAETAQMRSLAHHWVGRMLGWEWMAQKTELFGIPIRWATYNPSAPAEEINEIKNMLENMGTAAWGAFPNGTELSVIQGSTPGVAGAGEPTVQIQAIADRACDLIFLGQNLTSESGGSGSYALGSIHRQVELDLYQAYATYVEDVLNHQLIPAILDLNFGNQTNSPHVRLMQDNSQVDKTLVDRDKILFNDMQLPVSKTWLYNRHSVPEPSAGDLLYEPGREELLKEKQVYDATSVPKGYHTMPDGSLMRDEDHKAVDGKEECGCGTIDAASESTAVYEKRKVIQGAEFNTLLAATDLDKYDLMWSGGDCTICQPLNGTAYGNWTTPPPLHYNCDCIITVEAKNSI
tara:strand:+ start:940 stop:2604 length:1665 start_codon:yes stop_codon:yes gene_type:complete